MISNEFIWLDRINSPEEFESLQEKAKVDSHGLFNPTFKVVKHGELVGWVSIGQPTFPTCFGWLSKEKIKQRDGLTIMNMVENNAFLNGARGVILPMPKDSDFHPLMEKAGYRSVGSYDFFIKEF